MPRAFFFVRAVLSTAGIPTCTARHTWQNFPFGAKKRQLSGQSPWLAGSPVLCAPSRVQRRVLHNGLLHHNEKDCRHKRSLWDAAPRPRRSPPCPRTSGHPSCAHRRQAGTHADRYVQTLRARRKGAMGTLSAVLGVADRGCVCAHARCKGRLALYEVER